MAESLGWQSGVWKTCRQQHEAIAVTEAALRLLCTQTTPQAATTQARLLAQWAESAALLHLPAVVEEKLEAAASLLDRVEQNEEFDRSIWLYYNGTCAFYLGNFSQADAFFEQALLGHHSTWRHQRVITTLFQAQARLHLRELEGSLGSAHLALPLLTQVNAPLLWRGLLDYTEDLDRTFPGHPEGDDFLGSLRQHQWQILQRPIPRYLEATL
jgi:tetratricopeptide (TPR) repeat protein